RARAHRARVRDPWSAVVVVAGARRDRRAVEPGRALRLLGPRVARRAVSGDHRLHRGGGAHQGADPGTGNASMTEAAPPAVAEAPRRRRPGRAVIVTGAVVLALAAGALVAIPLGGWDTVELESAVVPTMEAGETYLGTHYSVRLEEAWVGD